MLLRLDGGTKVELLLKTVDLIEFAVKPEVEFIIVQDHRIVLSDHRNGLPRGDVVSRGLARQSKDNR